MSGISCHKIDNLKRELNEIEIAEDDHVEYFGQGRLQLTLRKSSMFLKLNF